MCVGLFSVWLKSEVSLHKCIRFILLIMFIQMKIFSFRVLVLLHGNGNDSNRINKNNKNNECWTIWRNVSLNCNLSNFLPIKTYYNTTYLRSIEVARFISTISIFLSFPFVHCIFSVRYSSFCRFSTL